MVSSSPQSTSSFCCVSHIEIKTCLMYGTAACFKDPITVADGLRRHSSGKMVVLLLTRLQTLEVDTEEMHTTITPLFGNS
jgi:hypothetical protein